MALKLGADDAAVIDASVCIKWFLKEPGSDSAIEILESGISLLAPDLLFAEFANVMWLKQRVGALTENQVDRALDELASYFGIFDIMPSYALMSAAISLARTLDHPVYDCIYLALAEGKNVPLMTADRRFHDVVRARRSGASIRLIG